MRTVVLVDGEHYPPVTRWAIATAIERGHDVVGALFVGGIEKIEPGSLPELGVPIARGGRRPRGGAPRRDRRPGARASCSTCPTSRCSATASAWSWRRWR